MNMTDRFNPANENDPKRKLAYGLIALACVIVLGLGLDAASCSRAGGAGDKGREQDVAEAVDGGSAAGATSRTGRRRATRRKSRRRRTRPRPPAFGSRASTSSRA